MSIAIRLLYQIVPAITDAAIISWDIKLLSSVISHRVTSILTSRWTPKFQATQVFLPHREQLTIAWRQSRATYKMLNGCLFTKLCAIQTCFLTDLRRSHWDCTSCCLVTHLQWSIVYKKTIQYQFKRNAKLSLIMQFNNSECIFPHRCVSRAYLKLNLQQNWHISFGDKPHTMDRHSPHYTFTWLLHINSR